MPRQYSISDMKKLAQEKGGKCLSAEYITQKTKLEWECEKGHRWWAAPDGICNNHTWCPKCANNVPHTLQEMQELAISRGGKCLSNEYLGLRTPLLWECVKGHRWSVAPETIYRNNTWCPECAHHLPY